MAALEELNALLENLPGYELLTLAQRQVALAGALIPDAEGRWPGTPNYITTQDTYWAAATLLGFLRAQPVVRQASSEGTSTAVDAPDWNQLHIYFKSQSVIAMASGGGILTSVAIPGGPHVRRTDMSGRGNGYDDVDTDLA